MLSALEDCIWDTSLDTWSGWSFGTSENRKWESLSARFRSRRLRWSSRHCACRAAFLSSGEEYLGGRPPEWWGVEDDMTATWSMYWFDEDNILTAIEGRCRVESEVTPLNYNCRLPAYNLFFLRIKYTVITSTLNFGLNMNISCFSNFIPPGSRYLALAGNSACISS